MDRDEVPDWASERHIVNGETHFCAHCLRDGEQVEIELREIVRMATWPGVNWIDGVEERVRCPNCGHSGHIRTKLMSEWSDRTRFVKDGVAAYEDAMAEAERNTLGEAAQT